MLASKIGWWNQYGRHGAVKTAKLSLKRALWGEFKNAENKC